MLSTSKEENGGAGGISVRTTTHKEETSTSSPNIRWFRAGEFSKKFIHHGQNRVFGQKNAQKKLGSPTPNFPPPQFGFTYLNKLGTALIHVTQIEEGENWA